MSNKDYSGKIGNTANMEVKAVHQKGTAQKPATTKGEDLRSGK